MKFEELLEGAEEDYIDTSFGVQKIYERGPCVNCGAPTKWADLRYNRFVCSTECQDEITKEYFNSEYKGE